MMCTIGLLLSLSVSCAARGDASLDLPQFKTEEDFVKHLESSPRQSSRTWNQQINTLMVALFHEKQERSEIRGRPTRNSQSNTLSNKEKRALRRSNTVRSLACLDSTTDENVWTLHFDQNGLPKTERITYAEIHFPGRDFLKDINLLRLKVGEISESVAFQRKGGRPRKNFKFDVTKEIRNILSLSSMVASKQKRSARRTGVDDISLIIFSDNESNAAISGGNKDKIEGRTRRDSARHKARRRRNRSRARQHRRMATVDRQYYKEAYSKSDHNPNIHPCRRVPFEVDFMKLGWQEWIIYPRQYQAYRCEGRCNVAAMLGKSPTNHAYVQSFVANANPGLGIPEACCVPSKLRPMRILYYENGETVQRDHEDMVVEECECR